MSDVASNITCVYMQATVRAPAARNMITKTLPMMYLIGTLPFLLLSFIGYWAYGNEVGYNILYSTSGPTWAIALAYVASAAQIIVSFHVSLSQSANYVAPSCHYNINQCLPHSCWSMWLQLLRSLSPSM